jgi:ElaB/YqjD/DUF883 family membrane-anchored ribosome-binding protein
MGNALMRLPFADEVVPASTPSSRQSPNPARLAATPFDRPLDRSLPVSVQPEIAAARDDVQRARDQLSDTIAELEDRITAPVRVVKKGLDVGQLVHEHPWAALAVAVGAGALVARSGADKRAATLTAEKAREGGAASLRLARETPAKTSGVLGSAVHALGAKLGMTIVDAFREPRVAPLAPEPRSGLGFVDNPAPAHEPPAPE